MAIGYGDHLRQRWAAVRTGSQSAIRRGRDISTALSTTAANGLDAARTALGPAVTATSHRAVSAIQRTEVRWQRSGRSPLTLAGVALLAVALMIWAVVAVAGNEAASTAGRQDSASVSPQAVFIERISNGRNGGIFALAGGEPLFPLPTTGLGQFDGAPVEMQDVPVHSVASEVGMWIGENDAQRVFVVAPPQAPGAPARAPLRYQPGDRLNLSGRFVPIAGFEQLGVGVDEGAEQLFRQNYMVQAVSLRPPTGPPSYR